MAGSRSGLVVYSTASYPPHPDFIIYNVIAGAIAYARTRNATEVHVRLLPLGLREHFRSRARGSRGSVARSAATGNLALDLGGLDLRMERYRGGVRFARNVIRAARSAWAAWRTCREGGEFSAVRFLELTHRGVRIGDLAGSESLRSSAGGRIARLRNGMHLFRMLLDCVLICDLCMDELPVEARAAVLVTEPTYRHAAYKRALRARGATVIELKMYWSRSFCFFASDEVLPHSHVARAFRGALSAEEASRADEYMKARLADPVRYLPYMTEGVNRIGLAPLRTDDGGEVPLPQGKAHVALFLHSFDDAQYFYGTDGFSDLCDWADFTLRSCLANPSVGSVLVKRHPNINHAFHAKTERTEEWLREEYAHEPRVVWLERTTSLTALAAVKGLVGITHHGSVAEELVFLGVPVIAFANAAWREGYTFVRAWADPASYSRLLASISPRLPPIAPAEMDSLRQFIHEYRLRPEAGDADNLLPYKKWLASRGRDPRGVADQALEDELSALTFEEARAFLIFLASHEPASP